jgi:hypothetical protein
VAEFAKIDPRFAQAETKAAELRRRWEVEQWELMCRQISSSTPTLGLPWSVFWPNAEIRLGC